jgi:hypothetical protein
MPPGCNSECSERSALTASVQTTRHFGLCSWRSAQRWWRGNFLGRDYIREDDRHQATFGLDNTLRLSAGAKDAERIRETATDSRAHDDTGAGFHSEEEVDDPCAHRAEHIPPHGSR